MAGYVNSACNVVQWLYDRLWILSFLISLAALAVPA